MDKPNPQFKQSQIQFPNQSNQNQQPFAQPRGAINNQSGISAPSGIPAPQLNRAPQGQQGVAQPNFNVLNAYQPITLPSTSPVQFVQINESELNTKIEQKESLVEQLNQKANQVNQTLFNDRIEVNDLNTKLETMEQELKELRQSNRNLEEENFQQKFQKDNEIAQLIKNIKQSNKEKQQLQIEIKQKQDHYLIQEQLIQNNNKQNEIQEKNLQMQQVEIIKLETENKAIEQQLSKLSLQQKNTDVMDKYESLQKQLLTLDQEILKKQEEIKEQEEKRRTLKQNMFSKDQTIGMMRDQKKKIDKKSKNSQEDIEQFKLEVSRQENSLQGKSRIIQQQEELLSQGKFELPNDYQKLQHNDQMLVRQIKDNSFEAKQQEKTNSKLMMNQKKQEQAKLEELDKQARAKQLQELQQKFQSSHGLLEICFLIDCTGSMDPYKKQAELCVLLSMLSVKKQTQRDTLWSLICYQDKAELRKLGAYQQLQFTDQPEEVVNYLQSIKCEGGGDAPEDLDGAMRQMIKNLKWRTQFRIAMLICDAPCHGTKFHDFERNRDDYPDDDLTGAVEQMIQNDIFFIGVLFTGHTNKMFTQIRNIYRQHDKEEYYFHYDLRNAQPDRIFEELVGVLTKVSQTATQTNVRGTKVKNRGKVPIENPGTKGNKEEQNPVEVLCILLVREQPNQNDFVLETFRVFRIEFSDQAFNQKYLEIQTIGVNDFKQIEEGQWSCLRSKDPFAQGAMKSAYLMIRAHQNATKQKELYVCKTPNDLKPFKTFQSAVQECLTHLITQKWMKKFNRDLDDAIAKKNIKKRYPQVIYSDLLIFVDARGNHWIAERYFEGEFVKYNNNYGYINKENTDLNKIANSFSVYSFVKSNFNYLICDIQGVKCCFTDPAICTMKNHKLEPTDLGQDGIAQFQVSFNLVKDTCKEVLQILDINV